MNAPFSNAQIDARRVATSAFHLETEGCCVLPRLTAPSTIARIDAELADDFAATPMCSGDFYGERTKRFGRVLNRSRTVAALALHPMILALAERILRPWCDTIQLNVAQAIEIHPGAVSQFPHRDQDMWWGEKGRIEYLVNVIWPLTPFTQDNGATLLWPGTHGPGALADFGGATPIAAESDPGDAIVFLGSTLHGAGANITLAPRRGIVIGYPGLFAAYNAGPTRYAGALATGKRLPDETLAYLATVTGKPPATPAVERLAAMQRLFVVRHDQQLAPKPEADRPAAPSLFAVGGVTP